jgi:hypothetical protein
VMNSGNLCRSVSLHVVEQRTSICFKESLISLS